jgi:hypothetical protein
VAAEHSAAYSEVNDQFFFLDRWKISHPERENAQIQGKIET